MKSWMCGKNVYFSACDNGIYDGHFCSGMHGQSIAGASQNASRGLDHDVDLIILQWYDSVEETGAASLFFNEDCTGSSGAFFANKGRDGQWMEYDTSTMLLVHFKDNEAGAIMVPQGYSVELCDEDEASGDCWRFEGMEDDDGRMVCQDLGGFSDKTSSLKVRKDNYLSESVIQESNSHAIDSWYTPGNSHTGYSWTVGTYSYDYDWSLTADDFIAQINEGIYHGTR